MRVLVACEFSGTVRDAFRDRGHYAMSCDLLPSERPGPHYMGDVYDLLDKPWDLLIAHPPCTYLCRAGARWWARPGVSKLQEYAILFVRMLMAADAPRIAIENPVGIISTAIRPPDQYIEPWQHGHPETKKTGLWLKNLPLLQPSQIVEGRSNRVHMTPERKDRWKDRSRTPQGIAEAMASQWGRL